MPFHSTQVSSAVSNMLVYHSDVKQTFHNRVFLYQKKIYCYVC
jgi:hypothetical protein